MARIEKSALLAQVAQLVYQANQLFIAVSEFSGEPAAAAPAADVKPRAMKPAPIHKDILTTDEAAAMVGCSRQAVYALVNRGLLSRHGGGRRAYFKRSELERYMLHGKKSSSSEIAEQADALLNGRGGRRMEG